MAVRRRPSYGFDIAGSNLGLRPEAGVSRSTLAQLFPEIDFGAPAAAASTAPEQVEKPEETTAATPTGAGVTALAEDTIPGSELEKYKVSGSLSYAAPFNIQVGPSGPQGRGSRLGYSGGVGTQTTTPTTTAPTQSASSVPLPEYKMPEIDLSPYESALTESQNIISGLSKQLSDIMASYKPETQNQQQTVEAPQTTETPTTTTPTTTTPAPAQPLRLQIKEAAAAGSNPTVIGKTGITNLISSGADVNKIEQQARAAGVTLGQKAQSAVDRAQVQQIAAAPVSVQKQVQQIAQATESGKVTQAAVKALISSGTSAAKIEKAAAKQGIDIGKQAQQLLNKAQAKKK